MTTSSPHPPEEIAAAWQLHERLFQYLQLLWNRYETQFVEIIQVDLEYPFDLEAQDLADALADLEEDNDIPF